MSSVSGKFLAWALIANWNKSLRIPTAWLTNRRKRQFERHRIGKLVRRENGTETGRQSILFFEKENVEKCSEIQVSRALDRVQFRTSEVYESNRQCNDNDALETGSLKCIALTRDRNKSGYINIFHWVIFSYYIVWNTKEFLENIMLQKTCYSSYLTERCREFIFN